MDASIELSVRREMSQTRLTLACLVSAGPIECLPIMEPSAFFVLNFLDDFQCVSHFSPEPLLESNIIRIPHTSNSAEHINQKIVPIHIPLLIKPSLIEFS